jgi:F-type H+-transporting ATPase subunit epsilon
MLAETAERSGEIDVSRAEAARERARKRLTEKAAGTDIDRARLALFRAMNRLKVADQL